MEIAANFSHSKIGNFLFKLCAKTTKVLVKHRFLYYLLMFTWALPVVLLGFILLLILLLARIFTNKLKFFGFHGMVGVKIGADYWGGFSLGLTFLRDQKSGDALSMHEWGHSIQLAIFGIFFIFIVAIPSVIRWWARTLNTKKKVQVKAYDAAWFEDAATQCGRYAYMRLNNIC